MTGEIRGGTAPLDPTIDAAATVRFAHGQSERKKRPSPLWWRGMAYWAYAYKRTWRSSITTSFLYPVLYLTAMGVGLGTLVNKQSHSIGGVPYLTFIAPGLLAATTMQIGANEAMYPVMGAIKWMRTYFAMLATPLRVIDVLRGHLTWIALRLGLVSVIYLAVLVAFGVPHNLLALLAVPVAMLSGLAFAAPLMAFAATQDKEVGFVAIYRFALIPMFLFSGIFYPVTVLPAWMRPIAYATPLYHGADLCRRLVLGRMALVPALVDVAVLLAVAGAGYAFARRTYRRRLAQ